VSGAAGDLAARKDAARKAAFAARKPAFLAGQGAAADILAQVLQDHAGKVLSGYMPMRTEIDPLPAMAAHVKAGGKVCVPVIAGKALPLKFREWTPGTALQEGEFGARIPASGAWMEPQVLIVPLLAFDRRLFRLGYGGGFYDRTLERLRGLHPVTAIGFAFSVQEVAEVPIEETDQPLDLVVTEDGIIRG